MPGPGGVMRTQKGSSVQKQQNTTLLTRRPDGYGSPGDRTTYPSPRGACAGLRVFCLHPGSGPGAACALSKPNKPSNHDLCAFLNGFCAAIKTSSKACLSSRPSQSNCGQGWKGEIQYPVYRQWVVRRRLQQCTVTAGKARVALSLPCVWH